MDEILDKLLPPILMDLEVSYATRPGQPKTGLVKFDAAVFIAQAILYACGKPSSLIEISSDVSIIIKKMKDEGQLGGHGTDDPPLVIFHPVTGVRLISEDEVAEMEKRDLERAERIRVEREAERRVAGIAAGEPQPPEFPKIPKIPKEPPILDAEGNVVEGNVIEGEEYDLEAVESKESKEAKEAKGYDYKKFLPKKQGEMEFGSER